MRSINGSIPCPDNANVVVSLEAKSGKAWRVFRLTGRGTVAASSCAIASRKRSRRRPISYAPRCDAKAAIHMRKAARGRFQCQLRPSTMESCYSAERQNLALHDFVLERRGALLGRVDFVMLRCARLGGGFEQHLTCFSVCRHTPQAKRSLDRKGRKTNLPCVSNFCLFHVQ